MLACKWDEPFICVLTFVCYCVYIYIYTSSLERFFIMHRKIFEKQHKPRSLSGLTLNAKYLLLLQSVYWKSNECIYICAVDGAKYISEFGRAASLFFGYVLCRFLAVVSGSLGILTNAASLGEFPTSLGCGTPVLFVCKFLICDENSSHGNSPASISSISLTNFCLHKHKNI